MENLVFTPSNSGLITTTSASCKSKSEVPSSAHNISLDFSLLLFKSFFKTKTIPESPAAPNRATIGIVFSSPWFSSCDFDASTSSELISVLVALIIYPFSSNRIDTSGSTLVINPLVVYLENTSVRLIDIYQ